MHMSFLLDILAEELKVDYHLSRKSMEFKKGYPNHCGPNGCIEESQHEPDKKVLATPIL